MLYENGLDCEMGIKALRICSELKLKTSTISSELEASNQRHTQPTPNMFSKIAAITALVGLAKATVDGFDISGYQESVDFAGAYKSGARFVMIKVRRLHHSQCRRVTANAPRPPRAPTTPTPNSARTTRARRTQA